ncbi:TIP41-like family-domain-containing protein [Astrocystis sublimbata]|nr:TIP41-like family-domain-containing protein [Astrocystis sublimbata]
MDPPAATGPRAPISINPIDAVAEPWPSPAHLAEATSTHRQGPFVISSRKLPISKAGPIAALEHDIGIAVPEMIFGDNLVAVAHAPTGWRIEFAARDALDAVDKTGENMLQVAYAGSWSASREQTSAGIREVVRPFDWSYSTTYKGSVSISRPPPTPTTTSTDDDKSANHTNGSVGGDSTNNDNTTTTTTSSLESPPPAFAPTTEPIPIDLLMRRDPIRFFDDVVLYESELDDNGVSILSVKLRVHDERMLLLCRLYMRLDNVVCRVRDTRVYVDFGSQLITRDYSAKEATFDHVKQKLLMSGLRPDGITIALRDANQIAQILPVVEHTLESVSLAP